MTGAVVPRPAAQQRASDPAASVWVSASAGSGKTTVLTDRVLRLLLAGVRPSRLLAITFTRAASAEMLTRINRRLSQWATIEEPALRRDLASLTGEAPTEATVEAARRLLARVLDAPGGLPVMTIHALCTSLLRRFPVEAEVSPHFAPMDEVAAAELLIEVRNDLLGSPPALVGDAVQAVAAAAGEAEFAALVGTLAGERARFVRMLAAYARQDTEDTYGHAIESVRRTVARLLKIPVGLTEDDVVAEIVAGPAMDEAGLLRAARALCEGGASSDAKRGTVLLSVLEAERAVRAPMADAYLAIFLTAEKEPRKKLSTRATQALCPDAEAILTAEQARVQNLPDRRAAARLLGHTGDLVVLGAELIDRYERAKAQAGALDYDDLILRTRSLLRPEAGAWVQYKLDEGLDHILVDEAQDTNPDQWSVIRELSAEFFRLEASDDERRRTVFVVGDEKQSIFSFQKADPRVFAVEHEGLAHRLGESGRRLEDVELSLSYRSTEAVLDLVNAVFADGSPAAAGLMQGRAGFPVHTANRAGQPGLVALWPELSGDEEAAPADPAEAAAEAPDPLDVSDLPVERAHAVPAHRRLAEGLARTVAGWIGREWLPSRGRTVGPGDILILCRSRTALFFEIVRQLELAGVAVEGVDRMKLNQQLAVQDLLALARAALLPEDDLTLAAVLKGPLIGIEEETLFRLAWKRQGTLWHRLGELAGSDAALAAAQEYLAGVFARADFLTPHRFFAAVLAEGCPADPKGSGRRAFAMRLGIEAEDPVDELLGQALGYQLTHPPSLQGFLAWLERADLTVKREMDEAGGKVRVMTVHGSKGLQAPIVVLPDTLSRPGGVGGARLLWAEADEGEPLVPGTSEDAVPLWAPRTEAEPAAFKGLKAAARAREAEEAHRLLYVAMTRAADRLYVGGCYKSRRPSESWYDAIVEGFGRLDEARVTTEPSPLGEMRVYRCGTVGEAAAAPPAGGAEVRAEAELPAWIRSHAPEEPDPPRPLAPSRPAEGEAEPAARSPVGPDESRRFRRGTLIHALLQSLPDLPAEARAAAAERYLATPSLRLDDEARADIAQAALRLLDDPDLAPLFGPGSRAEVAVTGRVGTGAPRLVSGQIDRMVVTGDAVLVVDYKTNRPPPRTPDEVPAIYWRQMAAYRAALAAVYPGRRIRCFLLWTDTSDLMELSEEGLASHAPGLWLPVDGLNSAGPAP